jgi:hypothetical protein
MANNNRIISKYDDYETEDESQDVPGGRNIIGILKNETIEDVFRVFGGTIKDTPYSLWNRVSDGVFEYTKNPTVINLLEKRTIQ